MIDITLIVLIFANFTNFLADFVKINTHETLKLPEGASIKKKKPIREIKCSHNIQLSQLAKIRTVNNVVFDFDVDWNVI